MAVPGAAEGVSQMITTALDDDHIDSAEYESILTAIGKPVVPRVGPHEEMMKAITGALGPGSEAAAEVMINKGSYSEFQRALGS